MKIAMNFFQLHDFLKHPFKGFRYVRLDVEIRVVQILLHLNYYTLQIHS